jgi:hypothetical protein
MLKREKKRENDNEKKEVDFPTEWLCLLQTIEKCWMCVIRWVCLKHTQVKCT